MMLCRIRAYDDHTVRRNTISSQLIIRYSFAAKDTAWRVESKRLFKYHIRIFQARYMLKSGYASTKHLVKLTIKALLNLRVLREQVPGPGQSIGCGLVACNEHRHQLITYLLIIHALSCLLVSRR